MKKSIFAIVLAASIFPSSVWADPDDATSWAYRNPSFNSGIGSWGAVTGYFNFSGNPPFTLDAYGQPYNNNPVTTETIYYCPDPAETWTATYYCDPLLGWQLHNFAGIWWSGGQGACYTVRGMNAWWAFNSDKHYAWDEGPYPPWTCDPDPCLTEKNRLIYQCGGEANIAWDQQTCTGYCKEDDAQYGSDPDKQCVENKNLQSNPVNIYNGNNIESETDIQLNSPFRDGFALSRYYNSKSVENSALGFGWSHSYSASLITNYNSDPNRIKIIDETGRGVYFKDQGGDIFTSLFKDRSTLELSGTDYLWHRLDEKKFTFNADGRLESIEDEIGNSQALAYDANGRLDTVTDNASGRVLKFQYDAAGVLTYVTDAAGTKTWVSYGSTNQNLTSVTYGDGSGFTYEYNDANDSHNMTKKLDKMGHFISSWAYDSLDRATDNTTRDGRGVVIDYDTHAAENKIKVTDVYGKIKFFTIDGSIAGKKKITNIEGDTGCSTCGDEVVRIAYNTDLRVTEIEYANSRIDKFENFDTQGNAQTEIQDFGTPNQRTISYTYHPNNFRKLSRTEASVLGAGNRETIWDFDNDYNATPNENPTSLVSRVIEWGFTKDATGATVAYEYITTLHYNGKGQVTSIDGPLPGSQDITTYSYDSVTGNLFDITLPLVGATSFSNYDAAGNPGLLTDVNQQQTTLTYDYRNRLLSSTTNGISNSWSYTLAGELETATDGENRTNTFTYDTTYGRLTRITDPLSNYLHYNYDSQGKLIEDSAYDAANVRHRYQGYSYQHPDHPGKLWKIINPDLTETVFNYDDMGNVNSVTGALTRTTTFGYDQWKRLQQITQPGPTVTSYDYDNHGNLTTVTDATNKSNTYVYDDLGRQLSETSPDTGATAYAYDQAGNPVFKSDASSIAVSYTYDILNRLTAINYPDATQNITYSYDEGTNGKGKLTTVTDPSGTTSLQYDTLGRLIQEDKTISGMSFSIVYGYDNSGLLTSITYPSSRAVTFSRDAAGQINNVQSTLEGTTTILADTISHKPFGPPSSLNQGNGLTISNSYDELYRLTSSQAGSVYNRDYTLDAVGKITAINDLIDPGASQSFGYDALDRLETATGKYGAISYTYDLVGNRLTKTIAGETETYDYLPGANKLQTISGANPISYTYDANGNITAKGDISYTYNQNNRLIEATQNSTTLSQYDYNALGRRVKKTADNKTLLFIYDNTGNLLAEVDENGAVLAEYAYLQGKLLSKFDSSTPSEVHVRVATSKGRALNNIPVYAFTDSGSYTGLSATTDAEGKAIFPMSDFADGSYTFRADYLTSQFWTQVIEIPSTNNAEVIIEEETAEVTVIVAGSPQAGVTVYLFNESSAYLGLYQTTDANGKVYFDLPVGQTYLFRADHLGNQYWSNSTLISAGGPNIVALDTGGGILTVTVQKNINQPLADLNTYLFSASGSYLGQSAVTDADGKVVFTVSGGDYQIRGDYLGYHFWSDLGSVHADTSLDLTIPHQDVTITVTGDNNGDLQPFENVKASLFTPAGVYLGQYQTTDVLGKAVFSLPEMEYQVRADYLSQQYWSEAFTWVDQAITVQEALAEILVANMGLPLAGISTYVFDNSGEYLGINGITDAQGVTTFRLPQGDYNFRADYASNQYWSDTTTVIPHVTNPIIISTGGGAVTLTLLKAIGQPLIGVKCYLFNDSGAYLGEYNVTNDLGEASFNLADGSYKIRVDYLGYQFWTDIFSVPEIATLDFILPHHDVTITVAGDNNGDVQPFESVSVYLFTPAGSYLGQYQTTDALGKVVFSLPERDYTVRADYLTEQYWSNTFNATDTAITVNEGLAELHVMQGATALADVPVYVFTSLGSYLGITSQTDAQGIASFRLPSGTYKFRCDYLGSQYWATEPVVPHQVNIISLNTGSGPFTLTLEKEAGSPMADVPVYVFTSLGSYLGISSHTDADGQVSFDLSDGDYKFRADYLGYQFWTNDINIPTSLTDTLTIAHQDVTITVNKVYGLDTAPLENIRVYLFTSSGSYMGVYADSDITGQVTFTLPQQGYKVRADYLASQYWSNTINWNDTAIDIEHGRVDLHVTYSGMDVVDTPVYLFSETGAYLGRYERTGTLGQASFILPAKPYKFRVDYNGIQYWSDVINVIAHDQTAATLSLELLALDLTNDPNPVRFDGKPPKYKPAHIKLASLGAGSLMGLLSQVVTSAVPTPKVYYFLNDHLGTPQVITDTQGQVVWQTENRPFGETNITTETVTNNFRFPGQYFDAETGLHYNWHRYYDPSTGRYLTPDPIGLAGGINPFVYASVNPINAIDPFGLDDFYFTVNSGTGQLSYRDDSGNTQWSVPANSGQKQGTNNPDLQDIPHVGPTQEGTYYIDLSNNAEPDKTAADGRGWGQYGWKLDESIGTKIKRKLTSTRGGGYYLHQDQYAGNERGTAGCVGVVGDENIEKVKKALEDYSKQNKKIKVIVDY